MRLISDTRCRELGIFATKMAFNQTFVVLGKKGKKNGLPARRTRHLTRKLIFRKGARPKRGDVLFFNQSRNVACPRSERHVTFRNGEITQPAAGKI